MPRRTGHTLGSNPACPTWKVGFCTRHWLTCSGKGLLSLSFPQGCGQMSPEPLTAADPWQRSSEQVVGKTKGVEREGLFLRKRRGTGHSGSGQLVQGVSQTLDLHELKWCRELPRNELDPLRTAAADSLPWKSTSPSLSFFWDIS